MNQVNLSEMSYVDLEDFIASTDKNYNIFIPIPSLGKTQSYRDICSDIVDAIWLSEMIAANSELIEFSYDNTSPYYYTVVTINCEIEPLKDMLLDGVVLFSYLNNVDVEHDRYEYIRERISEFEGSLETYETKFPDLLDFYYSNFVNGVLPEAVSEYPEEYRDEIKDNPEWKFGYWKSGYSGVLKADCFASCDGWIIPSNISLDSFFKSQKQKYKFDDLFISTHFSLNGDDYLLCSNGLFKFSFEKYSISKVVSALSFNHEDDDFLNEVKMRASEKFYVDSSGTILVVDDGDFYHVFYNINSLRVMEAKKLQSSVIGLVSKINASADLGGALSLDWTKMTDDDFENLCYDVIYSHPRFNVNTIRKLGHSRSRDGGRDIEVYDIAMLPGETPVKWIFQCKLVSKAKSLGGSKVQDIGDMLEQYNAGGFGVMTSVLIDATLYNKMDSICSRRNVKQMSFSVLELERVILKDIAFFERYFSS